MDILHRSGRIIENRVATDFTVQMDPIDWVRKLVYLVYLFSTYILLCSNIQYSMNIDVRYYFAETIRWTICQPKRLDGNVGRSKRFLHSCWLQ